MTVRELIARLDDLDGEQTIDAAVHVRRDWRDGLEPSTGEACEAVLHYARHDAYLPV